MLYRIIKNLKAAARWFLDAPKYYSDYDHERRKTKKYLIKLGIVKNIWIVSGLIMTILLQTPEFIAMAFTIALLTTFVAFMILDETD